MYLLAHDLGTSGDKATLFSTDGKLIGSLTVPYPLYNRDLTAEQDAMDWWKAVCEGTKALLASSGIAGDEVAAVSFSGQMMGCLPIDRQGRPLRRALIWADRRAEEESRLLRENLSEDRFYSIVGHRNIPSYGIQKAMWIKAHEPEIYERTWKFLCAKDFIVYQLTGEARTDVSDANGTECIDLQKLQWSDEILEAAGIDPDKLPEIVPSTAFVGTVTPKAAAETGLSVRTKVIMGAGDGVAANVGVGSVSPGKFYCCLGTSAWLSGTIEKPFFDREHRIVTWAHAVPGLYASNATMQFAGGCYSWLKSTVCLDETRRAKEQNVSPFELINREIEETEPGASGLLFLPHLIGERAPRWNNNAKGAFFGLQADTTRGQMLRSVVEGVAMNLALCFDILQGEMPVTEVALIGGSARSAMWQQTFADIFQTDVTVSGMPEETNSLGAAVIAGVGSGIYPDFSAIDLFTRTEKTIHPRTQYAAVYQEQKERFDRLYHCLEPMFS